MPGRSEHQEDLGLRVKHLGRESCMHESGCDHIGRSHQLRKPPQPMQVSGKPRLLMEGYGIQTLRLFVISTPSVFTHTRHNELSARPPELCRKLRRTRDSGRLCTVLSCPAKSIQPLQQAFPIVASCHAHHGVPGAEVNAFHDAAPAAMSFTQAMTNCTAPALTNKGVDM